MEIIRRKDDEKLALSLVGRLDTLSAPQLEKELNENLEGVETLVLDLARLDYVSSAGLRVLLAAHKLMDRKGRLEVVNVNPGVMEVFEMTGFTDILAIEE